MILAKVNQGEISDAPIGAVISIIDANWSGGTVPENHMAFLTESDIAGYNQTISPLPKKVNTSDYVNAVQVWLDAKARGFGYDNIATAVTYADEPSVSKFQQEGQKFRALRSLVWDYCYTLMSSPPTPVPTPQEVVDEIESRFASYLP